MDSQEFQETLFSSLHKYQNHKSIPAHVVHPFAASAEQSCALLQDLINTTDQLNNTLDLYASTPLRNPKLVSFLRQHSSLAHAIHIPEKSVNQLIDTLRARSGINYGESIPLDTADIGEWCISRLQNWGKIAGMEAFKDDTRAGGVTVTLAGKVLVIDVDFSFQAKNVVSEMGFIVSSVKTSFATTNSTANAGPNNLTGSLSLDTFLLGTIQAFCAEVQKGPDEYNPEEAACLGKHILEQLRYLVVLDCLAERKEGGGIRWFVDIDQLRPHVETVAKEDAQVVASSLSLPQAPLDVFILRGHALPLPYLISPSISFLAYICPSVYMEMQNKNNEPPSKNNSALPSLDISMELIRSLTVKFPKGATISTLSLISQSNGRLFPHSMSMPTLSLHHSFLLSSKGAEINHIFPQMQEYSSMGDVSTKDHPEDYVWVLDFTNGGRTPGIVMSQGRMRDIELIINPISAMDNLNHVNIMNFGTGSWVDLLLNPEIPSLGRYITVYRSPTSAHPPLHLRLSAPDEPGFVLEHVPVRCMRDIWGLLKIVREQCWLNEILLSCDWETEGLNNKEDDFELETEELQALLNGTPTPRKIPISVFFASNLDSNESLFSSSELDSLSSSRRTQIVMMSSERHPISGIVEVEITVTFDETRPRGVDVGVKGALVADISQDMMEEICRRGGTLSLPGTVWLKAHSATT